MLKNKQVSDAPESNAGDDFHVLWTIKKSFDLLNFEDDGLKAITVEGVVNNDKALDTDGSRFLGVDIAEYYSGESFKDAKTVIISQLKYSTRRITENWTFAKLYEGKKSGSYAGSIIHRLAQTFKTYLDEFGRDSVISKLKLKLVSNRNFNEDHKLYLKTLQDFLNQDSSKTYKAADLIKQFPLEQKALKNLQKASTLNWDEFNDFVRLLDLDDCGTESRLIQKFEIINAISEVAITSNSQFKDLYFLAWQKMMPESQEGNKNKITKEDLLHCFGFHSLESLFPVYQKFEKLDNLIEREQLNSILAKIITNNSGYPICLHGGAGIGKSTLSQSIKLKVPQDSEVILFDCYGEGAYLNPSDNRHLHKEALLHISNEMAKCTGSPFLLFSEKDPYIFIREFKSRCETAVKILKKRNPNSVLILIVDAADNSVTAAQKNQTKSFVQDLLNEPITEGVRLVVTSRTHRLDSLNLPANYIGIPLQPFKIEETQRYLTHYFPESIDKEIQEFHDLTGGVPRVQAEVLGLKNQRIVEIINNLKPNGKTLEELIQDKIDKACKRLGADGETEINKFFTNLITLPRPVPIAYLATLTGINEGILIDFTTDIWHGLILKGKKFSFRDEDFENYIRSKYKPQEEIYKHIADLFLNKANTDEYASINLGSALLEAQNHETLINAVLTEGYRSQPTDPLRNKEVYIERTKLAMKVSSAVNDNPTFFKLAFIAADVAKTDTALKNLLISNADIAALFGNTDSLHKIHLQSDEKSWSGSFHYQLAAIYSRSSNIELVKKHLKNAEKWVDWKQRQKETDNYDRYQITHEDISYGAEAYLRVFGSKAAFDWLNRWSPKDVVFHSANILVDNVFKYSDKEQIIQWLNPLSLPIYAKLLILDEANIRGIDFFNLEEIAKILTKILSRGVKFESYLLPSILSFCELLIQSNLSNRIQVQEILSSINLSLPERVPTFSDSPYGDNEDILKIGLHMKKVSLLAALNEKAITIDDLYPKKFNEIKTELEYHAKEILKKEKTDFDRFHRHSIAIYQLRANSLTHKNQIELNSKFLEICKKIKDDWDWRYQDSYWVHYKLNYLAFVLIDVVPLLDNFGESLDALISSFENKEQNRISLRVGIAKRIASIKGFENYTIRILDDIDKIIQSATFPSRDIVDYYIQIVRISLKIDKGISKFYFDKAIEAVQEIDLEAMEQIKCLHGLAEMGLPNENPKLAFEFARFVEYTKSRLGGYDGFPIDEGIKGITYLDCTSVFSLLCRWSHRYVVDIEDHILSILQTCLAKGFISPSVGSSMLPLNVYYWRTYVTYIQALVKKYNEVGNNAQKSYFVKNLLRDLKINCGNVENKEIIQKIYNEVKDGKFIVKEILLEFESYNLFLTELSNNKQKSSDPEYSPIKHTNLEKLIIDTRNIDITSASSLNEALAIINDENNERYFLRPDIDTLLIKVKNECRPEMYVQHLDAFLDINPELISFYSFKEALKERLQEWGFHPLVKTWKNQKFEYFLKLWFSNFCFNDHIDFESISDFANYFSIKQNQLLDTIISILPEKIDGLEAKALYETIQFIKHRLTSKENEETINWVLQRWNKTIKDEFGDGIWNEKYNPNNSIDEVISQTLRFTLGYPDKRIRWRGIHALRRLVNSGNIQILKSLLIQQNETTCMPFQHREYTFFWISAKLYLWICIARLSKEVPNEISTFKSEIFKELQNQELPHALIIYFIKKTCLNLNAFDKTLFTEDELDLISNSLTSHFKPVNEVKSNEKQKKQKDEKPEWQFDFDSLDTLPYWYSPLGTCFNLSSHDVAEIADIYITEKWGYVGEIHKDNHVQMPSDREYYLTSNRHGGLPTIENLRAYYEYHAMYCAAGDLLKTKPLLKTNYYEWESWDYWLESKGLGWTEYWVSDLRDSVPLDKRFWVSEFIKVDGDWIKNLDDELCDSAIGFSSQLEKETIIPYGGYSRHFGESHEDITIRSAIATLKTSGALLRALQTTKDNYDYSIPLEGNEHQIDVLDFHMEGWLKEKKFDYEGLDKDDPFANDMSKDCVYLGDIVDKTFDITYSDDFKKAFYKGIEVTSFLNWSNISNHDKYSRFESKGSILEVNIDFLLTFLKAKNVAMILECQIWRYFKEPDYKHSKSQSNKIVKLYLICPNGEVKTIRGRNYQIG